MSLLDDHKQWVGWCKNPDDNSDKVWAIIEVQDKSESWNPQGSFAVCWGRRGKKLQTKLHSTMSHHEVDKLIRQKESKGYEQIPTADLNRVYPEFEEDLDWVQIEGKLLA